MGWLVAIVLFVGAAAIVAYLVPLVQCPDCDGSGSVTAMVPPGSSFTLIHCFRCKGEGRITPLWALSGESWYYSDSDGWVR